MSLSSGSWSSTLFGQMSGLGFVGTRLMDFTDAVAQGSVSHVVGKSFTTSDVGQITGTGTGTGTGITGLSASSISSAIFSQASTAFGQSGSKLMDLTDAIGATCVIEMGNASLSSAHTPVFSGTGTVDAGSVTVVGSAWGSSIDSSGSGLGLMGSQWPNLASAIGSGQAGDVGGNGTGTVTITGSPIGSPSPGAGSGSGTIS